MFTQFFGNYLLENRYISIDQLLKALNNQGEVKLKLGVLAINAGYMTSAQVEKVHHMQKRVDRRFGTLAVDMGYMEDTQVNKLLQSQKQGYLILGQSLVDLGFMTMQKFEKALDDYKKHYSIDFSDFTKLQNEKMLQIVEDFYKFDSFENARIYTKYVSLLFRNIIRFVGDDFTPLRARRIEEVSAKNIAVQAIQGKYNIFSAIEGKESVMMEMAKRVDKYYSGDFDEYVEASVSEFLNLCNGLFCVNLSNINRIDLELFPQMFLKKAVLTDMKDAFFVPVKFTFGVVNFLIVGNKPTIIE